jgi:hypothetical protein
MREELEGVVGQKIQSLPTAGSGFHGFSAKMPRRPCRLKRIGRRNQLPAKRLRPDRRNQTDP